MRGHMLAFCTMLVLAFSMRSGIASAAAPLRCFVPDTSSGHELGTPITDALETVDPTQAGRLDTQASSVPSTCGASRSAPAAVDPTAAYPYRAYTFVNRSRSAACIEVLAHVFPGAAEIGALGAGAHQSAAYLGSFDPGDVRAGYLGDNGANESGPGTMRYAFDVPALAKFVVVVSWTGPAEPGFEPNYELFVGGCGQLVVTSIAPAAGPTTGDSLVTIKGSGFEGAAPLTVEIGAAATYVLAVDDNTLTALTGAMAPGTYDVVVKSTVVTDANGSPATSTLPAAFTYVDTSRADAGAGTGNGEAGAGEGGAGGPGLVGGEADGGVDAGVDAGGGGAGGPGAVADAGTADAGVRGPRPGGSGSGIGVPASGDSGGGCAAGGSASTVPPLGVALMMLTVMMRRRRRASVG